MDRDARTRGFFLPMSRPRARVKLIKLPASGHSCWLAFGRSGVANGRYRTPGACAGLKEIKPSASEVVGSRRRVRVLKAPPERYLDGHDKLLIHPQQAFGRPSRHAVERMVIGVAALRRCFPVLLFHLSRSLKGSDAATMRAWFTSLGWTSIPPCGLL